MDPSILSSISGQFGKALILGTLLPVVLFVVLSLYFAVPLLPYDWPVLERLVALDSSTVVAVTFVTIVLTGVLHGLNSMISRLYEGYPWRESWFGQWRIETYQARLRRAQALMDSTQVLRNELRDRKNKDDQLAKDIFDKYGGKIAVERIKYGQEIMTEFPFNASSVLPTRLGNVIRSAETYSIIQYNLSGVTLWARLRGKIDKEYSVALDDAKTPLDFALNLSILSALLALLILVIGLLYPLPLTAQRSGVLWGMKIISFVVVSGLAYRMAIAQARGWGVIFRGAFDLYRWDLLKQLGYQQMPTSMAEERALWGTISRQIIYGDAPGSRSEEQYTAKTFTYGYIDGDEFMSDIMTSRGVASPDSTGGMVVTLRLENAEGQKRTIEKVVVRDSVPDGYDYKWGTAACAGREVLVVGSNPHYFHVGELKHEQVLFVSYYLVKRKAS